MKGLKSMSPSVMHIHHFCMVCISDVTQLMFLPYLENLKWVTMRWTGSSDALLSDVVYSLVKVVKLILLPQSAHSTRSKKRTTENGFLEKTGESGSFCSAWWPLENQIKTQQTDTMVSEAVETAPLTSPCLLNATPSDYSVCLIWAAKK